MKRPSTPTRSTPLHLVVVALMAIISASKSSSFDGGVRGLASAFLPRPIIAASTTSAPCRAMPGQLPGRRHSSTSSHPFVVRRSAKAAASTRLHSLFGLGPAEVAIVLVAGLAVVGPSRLLEFSKGAGEVAGKTVAGIGDEWGGGLRSIPEEFRKGVEEGEIEARGRKARRMDDVDDDEADGRR